MLASSQGHAHIERPLVKKKAIHNLTPTAQPASTGARRCPVPLTNWVDHLPLWHNILAFLITFLPTLPFIGSLENSYVAIKNPHQMPPSLLDWELLIQASCHICPCLCSTTCHTALLGMLALGSHVCHLVTWEQRLHIICFKASKAHMVLPG